MEAWYALYTKPNAESQVARALENRGFRFFLPLLPPKSPQAKPQALFPAYLFVRLDMAEVGIEQLEFLPGLRRIVGFSGKPAVVSDEAIQMMEQELADEHELHTGRRQEGVFFAARTLFAKLSSGLGHVVAGAGLDLIKFPTGAKPGQVAHDVVIKLGILDGPVAALPTLLALFFYGAYRIDRARHTEIQRELMSRRSQPAATPASVPPAATLASVELAQP